MEMAAEMMVESVHEITAATTKHAGKIYSTMVSWSAAVGSSSVETKTSSSKDGVFFKIRLGMGQDSVRENRCRSASFGF